MNEQERKADHLSFKDLQCFSGVQKLLVVAKARSVAPYRARSGILETSKTNLKNTTL